MGGRIDEERWWGRPSRSPSRPRDAVSTPGYCDWKNAYPGPNHPCQLRPRPPQRKCHEPESPGCAHADGLEQTTAAKFRKHPDHAIITIFPGVADLTGAQLLADIGDDRFTEAGAMKASDGTAPGTAFGTAMQYITAVNCRPTY